MNFINDDNKLPIGNSNNSSNGDISSNAVMSYVAISMAIFTLGLLVYVGYTRMISDFQREITEMREEFNRLMKFTENQIMMQKLGPTQPQPIPHQKPQNIAS